MIKKFEEHIKEHYHNIESFDGTNTYRVTNPSLEYKIVPGENKSEFKVKFNRLITREEHLAQRIDIEELHEQFYKIGRLMGYDVYINPNVIINGVAHDFGIVIVNSNREDRLSYSKDVFEETNIVIKRIENSYPLKASLYKKIGKYPLYVTVDYNEIEEIE